MKRRDFIEQSCFACGAALLGISAATLESCSAPQNLTLATFEQGNIIIPKSAFDTEKVKVIRVADFKDDILVVKQADSSYKAFLMKCTHKNADLKQEATDLKCNLHGSRFSFDGKVTQGPAKTDLKSYPVEVTGNNLKVKVA